MKVVFVFLIAVALAYAGPAIDAKSAQIVKSNFDQQPEGPYQFNFETDNAIARDEVGELKSVKNEEGKDENVIVMRGSFSYVDPEGKTIQVTYYADETGYHAEGEHIPKAP